MSNKSEMVYIIDGQGEQYEVKEVNEMLNSLLDENLEEIYKSTKYFNELNLAITELVEAGLMKQMEGESYQKDLVEKGLTAFANEITKRFGKDVLKSYDSEVDLAWKENKPDLDKYKDRDKGE